MVSFRCYSILYRRQLRFGFRAAKFGCCYCSLFSFEMHFPWTTRSQQAPRTRRPALASKLINIYLNILRRELKVRRLGMWCYLSTSRKNTCVFDRRCFGHVCRQHFFCVCVSWSFWKRRFWLSSCVVFRHLASSFFVLVNWILLVSLLKDFSTHGQLTCVCFRACM